MAWPSGTKAGTSNVDQGTDKISLARPDIKQNIDNVNSIIDHYSDSGGPYSSVGTYTAQQVAQPGTLSSPDMSLSTLPVDWNLNTAQVGRLSVASGVLNKTYNITVTNGVAGGTYIFIINHESNTDTNVFNLQHASADFKFPGDADFYDLVQPQSNTVVSMVFDGTNFLCTYANDLR
jgi:hypothetical protein|tara:strand:+ start:4363 stop:4893 length:531 start_codon:yes stop_codon:yes gene_type:complete